MEMKVSDYDIDGFSTIYTLMEGAVTDFYLQEDRRYGFIKSRNDTSIFFHFDNGRSMGPYGIKPTEWIPRFTKTLSKDSVREPKRGDPLVFLAQQKERGVSARVWSSLDRYKLAFSQCAIRISQEKLRIATSPRYKAYPTENGYGALCDSFDGTLEEMVKSYPPGTLNSNFLVRFECETLDGWETCEDPRNILAAS